MQEMKNKLYVLVLRMILRDKDKIWLNGKQVCQIKNIIWKLDRPRW